jgi:hypothetical protein
MKHILILVLSSLGALGCYKTSKSTETDTGNDTDADADTDTDADADTDTDADADADTDADADADTDADADADTGIAIASDCADGHGRLDNKTGLCWQHPMASHAYEWQKAIDYCDSLTLGGHDDWRLPSREDFIEMLGGCGDPEFDRFGENYIYCDDCTTSATCTALFEFDTDLYWSSSPNAFNSGWDVNFINGNMYSNGIDNLSIFVRCVRSGPTDTDTDLDCSGQSEEACEADEDCIPRHGQRADSDGSCIGSEYEYAGCSSMGKDCLDSTGYAVDLEGNCWEFSSIGCDPDDFRPAQDGECPEFVYCLGR